MATTADHMAARGDVDLYNRFIAKAEQMGIPEASNWIQSRMGILVTQPVDGGQTVTELNPEGTE